MRPSVTALPFLLFCFASMLPAQSYQGGLRGSVKDPADAAVAIAKITLKDEATNITRATLTGV